LFATSLLLASIDPLGAGPQSDHHSSGAFELCAPGIGVVTRASHAIQGRILTEGYLTQPVLMLQMNTWRELISLKGTLNLEGATIERGELNAGIWGEGYVDRRHPHTYLHELALTAIKRFGPREARGLSLTLGKGFAPFGTDDPMSRPFEKYPINHHLAQVLERAVAIGALRTGRWIFELGSFNGDEPTSPGDAPDGKRYWDSWSTRITLVPWPQGEFQISYARLKSPESPSGAGVDQRKRSASIRLEDVQHSGYALVEWARTADYVGSAQTFAFNSLLAETWAKYDRLSAGLRFERTDRPDEERLVDPFRTAVPATDFGIAGRSRWTIITARLAAQLLNAETFTIEPFVEIARPRASPTLRPSGFDPRQFYGADHIWSVSAGAKLALGMSHMRMGRYGVAIAAKPVFGMGGMDMEGM